MTASHHRSDSHFLNKGFTLQRPALSTSTTTTTSLLCTRQYQYLRRDAAEQSAPQLGSCNNHHKTRNDSLKQTQQFLQARKVNRGFSQCKKPKKNTPLLYWNETPCRVTYLSMNVRDITTFISAQR